MRLITKSIKSVNKNFDEFIETLLIPANDKNPDKENIPIPTSPIMTDEEINAIQKAIIGDEFDIIVNKNE